MNRIGLVEDVLLGGDAFEGRMIWHAERMSGDMMSSASHDDRVPDLLVDVVETLMAAARGVRRRSPGVDWPALSAHVTDLFPAASANGLDSLAALVPTMLIQLALYAAANERDQDVRDVPLSAVRMRLELGVGDLRTYLDEVLPRLGPGGGPHDPAQAAWNFARDDDYHRRVFAISGHLAASLDTARALLDTVLLAQRHGWPAGAEVVVTPPSATGKAPQAGQVVAPIWTPVLPGGRAAALLDVAAGPPSRYRVTIRRSYLRDRVVDVAAGQLSLPTPPGQTLPRVPGESARTIAPFAPIAVYTERFVAVADDDTLGSVAAGAAVSAVLLDMAREPWTRDVLRSWAHVLAALPLTAQGTHRHGVGAAVLKNAGDQDPGRWQGPGAALIDMAHGRDVDALPAAIDACFALDSQERANLVGYLGIEVAAVLGNGGARADAIVAAAAATDTDTYSDLVRVLALADDGPLLAIIRHWVAIVAPSCATAVPMLADGAVASYLDAVLLSDSNEEIAALTALALTLTVDEALDQLYPLAGAVHDVLAATGGGPRLRASLLLHVSEFTPAERLLCRRAAAIVAAAATGDLRAMDRYITATHTAHGHPALITIVGVWLDVLSERLRYISEDPGYPSRVLGATEELLLDCAQRLRDGQSDAVTQVVAALRNDTDLGLFRELAMLLGKVLRIGETDHG